MNWWKAITQRQVVNFLKSKNTMIHHDGYKKEGISDKTKKSYLGYACTELKKAYQCQIIWYKELGGKWLSPEDYALAIEDAGRS